jgi:hypothetical protein
MAVRRPRTNAIYQEPDVKDFAGCKFYYIHFLNCFYNLIDVFFNKQKVGYHHHLESQSKKNVLFFFLFFVQQFVAAV